MSTDIRSFDPLDPEEIVPLTFDFTRLATEIVDGTAQVQITRHSGAADARGLSVMLVGAPQIVGLTVRQRVQSPQAGTTYRVRCRVDTPEGYRFAEAVLLPGETK